MSMPEIKIGVTGTGSLIGQAIIKSIKAGSTCRDVTTIGFDYFPETIGSFWVNKSYILPDVLKDDVTEEEWLEEFICIARKDKIEILFVGVDFELDLFAKNKNRIQSETGCTVMVSSPDVVKIADDKYLTYEFLKNNKFYYPETALPEELDKKEIKFPCVVKPRVGARSRNVFVAKNKDEVTESLRKIERPIIQELIGNPDKEYTCGVVCFDDEVKEMIVLRRDLKEGNTITAYSSDKVPKIIYKYVSEVASKLRPFGACNFQLRLDNKNMPKLFEINARHSGTTYMRSLLGFNEVEYILSYLRGQELPRFSIKPGKVKRFYDEVFIGSE